MDKFYNGTKLLSLKDINNNKPEIYMACSNRDAGKTTYFNRYCVNRFIKHKEKFVILNRFNYELDDCADTFFKNIGNLFFKGYTMTNKSMANGVYHNLYLNGENCGYAVSINNSDQIKKKSHLMSDAVRGIFDEFQSETYNYCPNEIVKFQSVHTSLARGGDAQVKYFPIIMMSNLVSLINPYFTEFNIGGRINKDTKFLRGDGFVLEINLNESAKKAQEESGFNRAFGSSQYNRYLKESVYLLDNYAFVDKPKGEGRYISTFIVDNTMYAIRCYDIENIIYVDTNVDVTFKHKIAVTTSDHMINTIMLDNNDMYLQKLRFYFKNGCVRFRDLKSKEAFILMIGMR